METFNIKELSVYLHCSISMVRKLVTNKEIPFYRIGNRLFFRKDLIDIWVNNKCVENYNK